MPGSAPKHCIWTWDLQASPDALWPLVSNTDRFNRDCGFPSVVVADPHPHGAEDSSKLLVAHHLGLKIAWVERPFEWLEPQRFGVDRHFRSGPFARILAHCEMEPRPGGGTHLVYQVWLWPANVLGRLALLVAAERIQFYLPFNRIFRRYDRLALQGAHTPPAAHKVHLIPGAPARLRRLREQLVSEAQQPVELVDGLIAHVRTADELDAQRIRAYALADAWRADRRRTLETCMHATRAGLLDLRWDVVCPHCRGAKQTNRNLAGLKSEVWCDTCRIDFVADFEKSVELTFTPNPAIRDVPRIEYCIGGPQITPHVVGQNTIRHGTKLTQKLAFPPGRYRLRAPGIKETQTLKIDPHGPSIVQLNLDHLSQPEAVAAPGAQLEVLNPTSHDRLLVLEHLAWADQATMATEVTCLQLFRELFATDVLRPDGKIQVGFLTVVFTDLKGSTALYRTIGDAPAFGRVLTHFDILRHAVTKEGGAVVKSMGDAIMAVFTRPAPALRAMLQAQRQLAAAQTTESATPFVSLSGPLALKAGIHAGPCIAINQNDRLDYFGTTVNVTSRLCDLCSGTDIVISDQIAQDEEIAALLDGSQGLRQHLESERTVLRGMGETVFEVLRVRQV